MKKLHFCTEITIKNQDLEGSGCIERTYIDGLGNQWLGCFGLDPKGVLRGLITLVNQPSKNGSVMATMADQGDTRRPRPEQYTRFTRPNQHLSVVDYRKRDNRELLVFRLWVHGECEDLRRPCYEDDEILLVCTTIDKDDKSEAGFRCRKSVLAAKSREFRRMFDDDEFLVDVKLVKFAKPRVVRMMLDFLYGNKFDLDKISVEDCCELVCLADIYLIDQLKIQCSHNLRTRLEKEDRQGELDVAQT